MSLSKKEVIVCAAVRFYQDYGNEEGIVIAGVDYDQCATTYYSLTNDEYCDCNEGFITNLKRFVTKYEALTITGRQNEMRFQDRNYLLPEDLY